MDCEAPLFYSHAVKCGLLRYAPPSFLAGFLDCLISGSCPRPFGRVRVQIGNPADLSVGRCRVPRIPSFCYAL